ncbi:hypothetical protein CHS0354_042186 [Potamilus streckersoni]|uniref:Uncharacterized protein n=1 Tax=Potamilus streckersoni TaxID=2493646 RepID=A0AAE0WET0_9BIVA|nr:hypothetical protein CHS0354_042186 [Potamilus streckersoni]
MRCEPTWMESQSDEKEYLLSTDEGAISLEADDILPVWRKICFAIGGAPYQMTSTVVGFFISIFLLEVAEIRPYYVAIILICGKIWDAITDPLCGYLVSRTDTRFGKFKPWILFSAPLACGAYFALWHVPDFSEEEKFAWYFVAYCLFQGLLTGLHVPFTSLTMYISHSQKERDSATAYRMVSEATGVLLAVVIQGQLVNKYRTAGECSEEATVSPTDLQNQIFLPILISQLYLEESYMLIGYNICRFAEDMHVLWDVTIAQRRSMLPDVLDMFMLEKGVRKDAIFYSFYVFFNKLSTGFALDKNKTTNNTVELKTNLEIYREEVCLFLNLAPYSQRA